MSDEKEIKNPLAFPESCTDDGHRGNVEQGMTLRDYFAAKCINGIILHELGKAGRWEELAEDCYKIADAMLKERLK